MTDSVAELLKTICWLPVIAFVVDRFYKAFVISMWLKYESVEFESESESNETNYQPNFRGKEND